MSHHTENLRGSNEPDPIIGAFFGAAGDLVAGCLAQLRGDDPDGYRALSAAVATGACFRLVTEFSAAGPLDVRLLLINSDGEAIEIGGVEAAPPTFN